MTLKTRLTAMMVLLLMAVIVLQYLLAERERRAFEKRLAELSSHVNLSTRAFAERSLALSRSFPDLDASTIVNTIRADTLALRLGGDANYEIVVFTADGTPHADDARLREFVTSERVLVRDSIQTVEGHVQMRGLTGQSDSLVIYDHRRWVRQRLDSLGSVALRGASFPWVSAAAESGVSRLPPTTDVIVNLPLAAPGSDSLYGIQVRYPFDDLANQLADARTRSLAWLGTLLGVGVVGAFLMSNQLTRPIRNLQSSFGRVQRGDLDVELQPERSDEIGKLISSFNEMVARLKETREMESRLAESEHLASLGRLAAGVAHEVRNPLNAILLSMQQLRDRVPQAAAADGDFARYYGLVTGEIARLERMVSTFLDLSRVKDLTLEEVDAMQSLRASIEIYAPEARAKGVTIAATLPESTSMQADPARLPQVWNNLLSNAVAVSDAGGRIEVVATADAQHLRVEVCDTGPGIDAEVRQQIWEPFYSGRPDGIGLGLSIVRSAVRAHGGDVTVSGRAGPGCCFQVILPRTPAALHVATRSEETMP